MSGRRISWGYALYGALFLLVCLWWEAIAAFFKGGEFGIGVGTVVMVVNASLLSGYTFGCHSFRHLIGGRSQIGRYCHSSIASGIYDHTNLNRKGNRS